MSRRAVSVVTVAGAMLALAGCSGAGSVATSPSTGSPPPAPPRELVLNAGVAAVRISAAQRAAIAALPAAAATSRVRRLLPPQAHKGRWSATLRWSASDLRRVLAALRGDVSRVGLPAPVWAVQLWLPAIKQLYRNDCEAASMAMLLAGRFDQRALQRMLPAARPTAPLVRGSTTVWGDPELGYVGLANGYGYGVYDRPVMRILRRFQPHARNLTGTGLPGVLGALRKGRPVIAWIQLGTSRPRTWVSPAGRIVRANFAEHAVLLTGYRAGVLSYNNPWTGDRESFTLSEFLPRWHLFGDRAVAGDSLFGQRAA
jgi:uncharacterized protein YvpB